MNSVKLRERLAYRLETAAASDNISLRTLMIKSGGAAALKAMDQKAAAIRMKQAADEIKQERTKQGHSGGTKFDTKEVVDWVKKNCPTQSQNRKQMTQHTTKDQPKKLPKQSHIKFDPDEISWTAAEDKLWAKEANDAQKSNDPKVRMAEALAYLAVDVNVKTHPDGSQSGKVEPDYLAKWLPNAMRKLGMVESGKGVYLLPSGDTFFVGKDSKGEAHFTYTPRAEETTPDDMIGKTITSKSRPDLNGTVINSMSNGLYHGRTAEGKPISIGVEPFNRALKSKDVTTTLPSAKIPTATFKGYTYRDNNGVIEFKSTVTGKWLVSKTQTKTRFKELYEQLKQQKQTPAASSDSKADLKKELKTQADKSWSEMSELLKESKVKNYQKLVEHREVTSDTIRNSIEWKTGVGKEMKELEKDTSVALYVKAANKLRDANFKLDSLAPREPVPVSPPATKEKITLENINSKSVPQRTNDELKEMQALVDAKLTTMDSQKFPEQHANFSKMKRQLDAYVAQKAKEGLVPEAVVSEPEPQNRKTAYEAAKQNRALVDKACDDATKKLKAIKGVGSGGSGLTPDSVRALPEYKRAKAELDRAFKKLQDTNLRFTKEFKKESAQERKDKYAKMAEQPVPEKPKFVPGTETLGLYHTDSGKEAVKVRKHTTSDGTVSYSYTGSYGAGSGGTLEDMKKTVKDLLANRKGVKTITPFE